MKSLIAFTWIAFNFTASAHALVAGPRILSAQLDHQNTTAYGQIAGGSVAINLETKEITLVADHANVCAPGKLCTRMLIAPITVTLPLVDVSINNCGATVYEARQDARPMDGSLEVLQITDNTNNNCETIVAVPATEVGYENSYLDRSTGQESDTNTRFSAQTLHY